MDLRFPGQIFDQETGLHYNFFRDYDPRTGRYVERDPIGLRGGDNLYGYVEGRPFRYADPLGLNPGDLFATPDDAAIDAANYARSFSMQRIEYGGWIYAVGKCYTYSITKGTGGSSNPGNIPNGASAGWHTHPSRGAGIPFFPQDEEFSNNDGSGNGDASWVDYWKMPLYLNTPQGKNKVMTPNNRKERVLPKRKPNPCKCQ